MGNKLVNIYDNMIKTNCIFSINLFIYGYFCGSLLTQYKLKGVLIIIIPLMVWSRCSCRRIMWNPKDQIWTGQVYFMYQIISKCSYVSRLFRCRITSPTKVSLVRALRPESPTTGCSGEGLPILLLILLFTSLHLRVRFCCVDFMSLYVQHWCHDPPKYSEVCCMLPSAHGHCRGISRERER